MLGERKRQRNFFDAVAQLDAKSMGVYGRLGSEGHKLFKDEDFAVAYCPNNGRPSTPPSMLAIARLLQHYENISDAKVIECCKYDLRWKVALDLDPLSLEAPFVKSTLQGFRARLTLHLQEGLAFEKSVQAARESGLLPKKLCVALDSSPVRGRGAVKDTFNLISDAIQAVVRSVAKGCQRPCKELAAEANLERHLEAASIKGSELVDWNDSQSVSGFLGGLLVDAQRAVALAEQAGCASEEAELLGKIVEQDVGAQGERAEIRQGVAKDRTVSVSDPEMRHGRKSTGKTYNGHKAHLAVEVESGVVTAVAVTAPAEADGAQLKSLVEQTQQRTGLEVLEVLGDSAYSSRVTALQAQEVEVELKTKMPGSRKGFFGPGEFVVSANGCEARCPAGHASSQQSQSNPSGGPSGRVHSWSEQLCGSCPLKECCTQGKRRSLSVPTDFHERRAREHDARSPQGRQHLRQRVAVEHAIGRMKNLGAGLARRFGRSNTASQWLWTAAVINLSLVWGAEDLATV